MRAPSSPGRLERRRRRSRRSRRPGWASPSVRSTSSSSSRTGCDHERFLTATPVKLRDFLAPERIVVPLVASSLQEASDILLERLSSARGVLDVPRLRRRAAESRAEDVVAMGDRAFLIHYRTDAVGQLVLAVGIMRTPVCREEAGSRAHCARIVLLIAAPPRHAARYLQVV